MKPNDIHLPATTTAQRHQENISNEAKNLYAELLKIIDGVHKEQARRHTDNELADDKLYDFSQYPNTKNLSSKPSVTTR